MVSDVLRRAILRTKSAAFSTVRRGPREVVWPLDHLGLGNLLYLCMWANEDLQHRRVLETAKLARWYDQFPSLRELAVRRGDVGLTDRRLSVYGHSFGRFGEDFSATQLERFVRTRLLPHVGGTWDTETLVVNVRRGDYFDNPENRMGFAFDQDAYLKVAVERAVEHGNPSRIRVVSDGMAWCRARLGWLRDHVDDVDFADGTTPMEDFRSIATAGHLVLTNSTFSYWGGYVRDVIAPPASSPVVAPRFFHRTIKGGRTWPMPPEWSIIEDIPGGWDS